MKQKLVDSGAKISLFGSVFGAHRYRNDSDNFSFFFDTFNFTGLGDSVKAQLVTYYAVNCETRYISKVVSLS